MQTGLGIDTGGTYTDSVIIDMASGEVLDRSKALTTRDDLTTGIQDSLSGLNTDKLRDVSIVSLSSTLATNSVVEGKSCRVGLISIGKEFGFTVQPHRHHHIDGKFNFTGDEVIPLDINRLEMVLESLKGEIDSLAVAGYLSVRNPSHENAVRDMARRILDVPVVCAHELSTELGFAQRANTAIVNAGLIPVITGLISAVRRALESFSVDAPLMVVKGDGSVMTAEVAMERPVETILSGPASSLTGAMTLTGLKDALIVDMGGTTSDIGVVRNGFPRTLGQGAVIGGHRTRVHAADIGTYGIGGDSRIVINGDKVLLSPSREIPICIAASRWPSIKERLLELDDITDRRSAEAFELPDVRQDVEFFTTASNHDLSHLSSADRAFIGLLAQNPLSLVQAAEALDIPLHSISISKMESTGYITRIGVTPTDILAAEGTYGGYDPEASRLAVSFLSRKLDMDPERFIGRMRDMITRKIASSIMEDLLLEKTGLDSLDDAHRVMIDEMMSQDGDYSIRMHLNMPMVGIGAPVSSWLPGVARMLDTEVVLPENHDVGNAIGTITGSVTETAVVNVRAVPTDMSEDPECDVFYVDGKMHFDNSLDAIDHAVSEGKRIATQMAISSGATEPVIDVSVDKTFTDLGSGRSFRGAVVSVRATGRPAIVSRR